MRIKEGERTLLDARAKAEAADSMVTEDFYTQLAQLRLSPDPTSRQRYPRIPTDALLDEIDVGRLVECALRHPAANMRQAVVAAIRGHPASFREIFRFGLTAPAAFAEVRAIVAEELARRPTTPEAPEASAVGTSRKPLLPRMPLPAHLQNSEPRG